MNPFLWLNGHKQAIGLFIFGVGCLLEMLGIENAQMIRDTGGAMAGFGALAKSYKLQKGL